MSREQIFAVDMGMVLVSLSLLACYILFKAAVMLYALADLEDYERRQRADDLIAAGRSLAEPVCVGFYGALVIAMLLMSERFSTFLDNQQWALWFAIGVWAVGFALDVGLWRAVERKAVRIRAQAKGRSRAREYEDGGRRMND